MQPWSQIPRRGTVPDLQARCPQERYTGPAQGTSSQVMRRQCSSLLLLDFRYLDWDVRLIVRMLGGAGCQRSKKTRLLAY
jgi:hypothetical protein